MTLFDASGTAAGVGTATVTATMRASGAASFAGLAATSFTGRIVDYYHATAAILGAGQVTGSPTVKAEGLPSILGVAGTSFTAQVTHEATAHLAGSSGLQAPIVQTAGTTAGVGNATVTAAVRYGVGGHAAGAGTATLGAGQRTHWSQALLAGSSSVLAPPVHVSIVGGVAAGFGDIEDGLLVTGAGTAVGVGAVQLGTVYQLVGVSGYTAGSGSLNFSEPLPMLGIGTLVAFAEIQTYPPPYCRPICGCERCCGRREEHCFECHRWHEERHHHEPWWWQCRECWQRHAYHREEEERHREWSCNPNPEGAIGEFRWNQTFGKGGLEICLKDRQGNQRGPVFIGYTMFMVSSTGILHQIGPTDRKPAQADVGKFYVTGTAGENGQPGCWAVRWRYQRTYSEPIIEQYQQFRVVDSVLDCDRPEDHHIRRHCKYGWDL